MGEGVDAVNHADLPIIITVNKLTYAPGMSRHAATTTANRAHRLPGPGTGVSVLAYLAFMSVVGGSVMAASLVTTGGGHDHLTQTSPTHTAPPHAPDHHQTPRETPPTGTVGPAPIVPPELTSSPTFAPSPTPSPTPPSTTPPPKKPAPAPPARPTTGRPPTPQPAPAKPPTTKPPIQRPTATQLPFPQRPIPTRTIVPRPKPAPAPLPAPAPAPAPAPGPAPAPVPGGGGTPAWLTELNRIRAANGLNPVVEDKTLSAECVNHVAYMKIHGMQGHFESPGATGYTPEGHKCAKESNLVTGARTELDTMRIWKGSPGHYKGMIRPGLKRVGFAYADGYGALNVIAGLG